MDVYLIMRQAISKLYLSMIESESLPIKQDKTRKDFERQKL